MYEWEWEERARTGRREARPALGEMADILKVTTPLVSKSQALESKRGVELATQFPLQDVTRVTRPASQSELLGQNNGAPQHEETSALLLNLLKDPSVTVNFLKNISAMEAIIKLLPANNSTFTQEIERLFDRLLLDPGEIAQEMGRQADQSTLFKGGLFEFLREALRQNPEQEDLQRAEVSLLKALTLYLSRGEALGSVANSLEFLSDSLSSSHTLAEKLSALAARFRAGEAPERFESLKQETLDCFQEIEDSILFSPKMAKVLPMTVYNLSRYNDNAEFLQDAVGQVLMQLRGEPAREEFLQLLGGYLREAQREGPKEKGSSVMEVLTRILGRQAQSEELMALNSDKVEKIIHSLLSSPCNFTPLLHYVIPVQYEDLQSFAEIWINPNGREDDREGPADAGQVIHLLLVFDITGIGRFEMELFVRDKTIDFSLLCPPAYARAYMGMEEDLRRCVGQTEYRFGEIQVDRLERSRSLMDVFRSLPYKRTGVDVKI